MGLLGKWPDLSRGLLCDINYHQTYIICRLSRLPLDDNPMIAWELFCGCCGDDDYGFYYSDDCVGIFTMMVVFLIVMIVVVFFHMPY